MGCGWVFGAYIWGTGCHVWLVALAFMHVFIGPFKNADEDFWAASVALGSNYGILILEADCNGTIQKRLSLQTETWPAQVGKRTMINYLHSDKSSSVTLPSTQVAAIAVPPDLNHIRYLTIIYITTITIYQLYIYIHCWLHDIAYHVSNYTSSLLPIPIPLPTLFHTLESDIVIYNQISSDIIIYTHTHIYIY